MIDPKEFNKILEWFGDEEHVEKLSPLEFGQYIGAAMEFVEKIEPIYSAHNKDSFEWIVRDLYKDGGKE